MSIIEECLFDLLLNNGMLFTRQNRLDEKILMNTH